ncbi:MAG: hypothetical protein GY786_15450 [Proteobacteria bacterium]|nr:hypothetical protein [Pseudomonadota bacterium]
MDFRTLSLAFHSIFSIPRLVNLMNGILLTGIAWTAGSLGAKILEEEYLQVPATKKRALNTQVFVQNRGRAMSDFNAIVEMNVFDVIVKEEIVTPKIEPKPVIEEVIQKPVSASLAQILNKLELKGITSGSYYFATIYHKQKREEDVLIVGDEVFDTGAVISGFRTKNKPVRVLIKLGDEIGSLLLNPVSPTEEMSVVTAKPVKKKSRKKSISKKNPQRSAKSSASATRNSYSKNGKDYFISSAEVDQELNDFPRLLNQARVVPYMQNGAISGFQIKLIEKGSLYEKLGFKNKDVIQDVNGEFLGTPEKAMKLLSALRNEREISVSILREGTPKLLSYHIN